MRLRSLVGAGALLVALALPLVGFGSNLVSASSSPVNYGLELVSSNNGTTVAYQALITDATAATAPRPWFQFWDNSGQGWHMVQNYSSRNTFDLSVAQASSTLVMVFALAPTAVQAGNYRQAQWTAAWYGVPPVEVSMTTPPSPAVGASYTISGSESGIPHAVYQLWVKGPSGHWNSSGAYQASANFSWTPSVNGSYEFVLYARDGQLPPYAADEISTTATVSTAGQPTGVLLQSALPLVPSSGTKTVTVSLVNAVGGLSTYSGPVTVAVQAEGAFAVKGPAGAVSAGNVTVEATNGRAVLDLIGGSTVGASGTLAVTAPFTNPPVTFTVAADSATAQAGYAFFTPSGARISSANPLVVTTPVNPFNRTPEIPVVLKAVNVFGQAIPAAVTDDVYLSPVAYQADPSSLAPGFQGSGVVATGTRSTFAEYVLVTKGTTANNLDFFPAFTGLTVLSAHGAKLVAHGVTITKLQSSAGTVLTPIAGQNGTETVVGVLPNTTYTVTAQVVDQFGEAIAESAFHGTPTAGIGSSAPRSTASLVSAPTATASGQWTFTYVSGSAAGQSDTLTVDNAPALTTNPF